MTIHPASHYPPVILAHVSPSQRKIRLRSSSFLLTLVHKIVVQPRYCTIIGWNYEHSSPPPPPPPLPSAHLSSFFSLWLDLPSLSFLYSFHTYQRYHLSPPWLTKVTISIEMDVLPFYLLHCVSHTCLV